MKEKLLKIIQMLHVGGMIDGIIEKSLSEEGIKKDDVLNIVKENVQIKNIIVASFKLGTEALKEKASSDGKTDWLDALAQIIDLTDEMIAEAIGEYLEKLLNEEVEPQA